MKKKTLLIGFFFVLAAFVFVFIQGNSFKTAEVVSEENSTIVNNNYYVIHVEEKEDNGTITETTETSELVKKDRDYENLIIYNDSEDIPHAFLIYMANLNDWRIKGSSNIVFIKNLNLETYQELKIYFYEREINSVTVLPDDVELGNKLRENLGVSVLVKAAKNARMS